MNPAKSPQTKTAARSHTGSQGSFFGGKENSGFFGAEPSRPQFFSGTTAGIIQKKCSHCEQAEKKKKKQGPAGGSGAKIHRKPIFDSKNELKEKGPMLQKKCAACEKKDKLQRKEATPGTGDHSADVESSLQASKGGGTSLPGNVRTKMEDSFGADFSGVRIHSDQRAVQMSEQLGAQAFTQGRDIYFNAGKYAPGAGGGNHLLAHELTHTIQQGYSPLQGSGNISSGPSAGGVQAKLTIGEPGDAYERQADQMADKVVQRFSQAESAPDHSVTGTGSSAPVTLQREPLIGTASPAIQKKAATQPGSLTTALHPSAGTAPVQMAPHQAAKPAVKPAAPPPPKSPAWETDPLEEVYFTRDGKTGQFIYAIPRTTCTVAQLAEFLFGVKEVLDPDLDEQPDPNSPAGQVKTGIRDLNSLRNDTIYAKTHLMLGDIPQKFHFSPRAAILLTQCPIFSNETFDPEFEVQKMGVSSLAEFRNKKRLLDEQLKLDLLTLQPLIYNLRDFSYFNQQDHEAAIMEIIKKWLHVPLVQHPLVYPNGGEYFDHLLLGLEMKSVILKNILADEWTNYYNLLFNHLVYNKDELNSYKEAYSYIFKGDKPQRELSLWTDLAKPGLQRIPGIVTEELACFVKGIPLDITQDLGDKLDEGAHYLTNKAVSDPDQQAANQMSLDIACFAGGVAVDLATSGAKFLKVIEGLRDADNLYKTYKEMSQLWDKLPGILKLFHDEDTFLDILFGLQSNPDLDRLEAWVMAGDQSETPAGNKKPDSATDGIAKFKKAIQTMVSILKKIIGPLLAIRRKFLDFLEKSKTLALANPKILKVIMLLKAGSKIASLEKDLSAGLLPFLNDFLSGIKDKATGLVTGIGDKINQEIDGIKTLIENAISDFAISAISKASAALKGALKIPSLHAKANSLITEYLVSPLFAKIHIDDLFNDAHQLVGKITGPALKAIDYVFDTCGKFLSESISQLFLQREAKETNPARTATTNGRYVENKMAGSSGEKITNNTRQEMEGLFGQDFSGVRIHQDQASAQASESVQAKAFTTGKDIFFNEGQYAPGTKEGRHLLAHELTHVVQQGGDSGTPSLQKSEFKRVINNLAGKYLERVLSGTDEMEDNDIASDEEVPNYFKIKKRGKVKERTQLGTFIHSEEFTQFCNWLDTQEGLDWIHGQKLKRADFALGLPTGKISREYPIPFKDEPNSRRSQRADVVDWDNWKVHEIKPANRIKDGDQEAEWYANLMNELPQFKKVDDKKNEETKVRNEDKKSKKKNGPWTAGKTLTYDGNKILKIFRRFEYFNPKLPGSYIRKSKSKKTKP